MNPPLDVSKLSVLLCTLRVPFLLLQFLYEMKFDVNWQMDSKLHAVDIDSILLDTSIEYASASIGELAKFFYCLLLRFSWKSCSFEIVLLFVIAGFTFSVTEFLSIYNMVRLFFIFFFVLIWIIYQ